MKKILLPTDFSKASEKAIHYALALFSDTACEFTLLNTYGTNVEPEIAMYVLEELRVNAQNLMKDLLKDLKKFDNEPFHTFKLESMPISTAAAIEFLNQTEKYDLVVLGASGAGNSLLFGSVATEVVRNVPINTLVVPTNAPINQLKNIVLAADYGSISDYSIFENLKSLAERKSSQLTFLTILQENQTSDTLDGLAKYEFHNYFSTLQTNDYFIKSIDVEHGIKDFIDVHRVDLLVMVSRHHSFLDIIFNRSVTRKFAFHPSVPLLSIYDELPAQFINEAEVVTF
ncbi:UspA domain-containing protein [Emticicia oligotrophica DSM 17448]|uniref:UspA domain-containing protein n=1 Tax=Emticicia oligotrophica (strain DSM 17448 / CIP 109782 / MTCC 6937 / GPTSA100-15) TaxID=929562 RepID=A0ABM5MWG0_EMTOG|nr:universal stress protein [Emticicia oligotrophica]AFK01524.1 UspA domain-containing protein [Emticicia oligotrophica DSM 17448]